MTSSEGAILILPEGASLSELEDKVLLGEIRGYAARFAPEWCKSAQGRDTLYLITAVFKSKSWALGAFSRGSDGREILVHRRSCGDSFSYRWESELNVDNPVTPINNSYLNQAVFIKGFKMTVRTQGAKKAQQWPMNWMSRVGEWCSLVMAHSSVQTTDSHP